jgi:hypothetical protein
MSRREPSFQELRDRIPFDRTCTLHGAVTRYHGCRITHPAIFGKVLVAKSEWMGKVPTGPATMGGRT